MKKAKKILALLIAAIMIFSIAVPQAFAADYTTYRLGRDEDLNSIKKYEFSSEQAATYILDLVDQVLYDANIAIDFDYTIVAIDIQIQCLDDAFWYIYHLLNALVGEGSSSSAKLILSKGDGLSGLVKILMSLIDLENLDDLSLQALKVNGTNVYCARCVPTAARDYATNQQSGTTTPQEDVLFMLLDFLGDNAWILSKLGDSTLDLGTVGGWIIDAIGDDVEDIINDFDGWLKNLLYKSLWDDSVDEAPSGWTYDEGIQTLVNWLLIDGTGTSAETGGTSVLGENFEAFLPNIANYPGGASIGSEYIQADRDNGLGVQTYKMGAYQLVNNAINALMSGMLYDLLQEVLYDALDIGKDPDEEIMSDMIYQMIVGTPDTPGMIETLLCQNGAPAVDWTGVENKPAAMIDNLLTWLLVDGALDVFIKIDYNGIAITDNFMALLSSLLDLLPTLMPLLGISVPSYMARTDLSTLSTDEEHGQLYLTWAESTARTYDKQYVIWSDDPNATSKVMPTYYYYVGDDEHEADAPVNIDDPSAPDYHEPALIKAKKDVSDSEVWAYIVKILLASLVEGCYIPDYADSVASVGAYALASLAAVYMPENNYWDRLDAYYYQQHPEAGTFVANGNDSNIEPLAWTETMMIGTKEVEVPRAAMDIGAAIASYFLNGAFPFANTLGYNLSSSADKTFEEFVFEFLLWGATQYINVFTGKYNPDTREFSNYGTSSAVSSRVSLNGSKVTTINAVWKTQFQNAVDAMYSGRGEFTEMTNQERANILYGLLDNTVFSLIPDSWLPTWMSDTAGEANGGTASTSATLFEDWLLNSVMNIDLQKIFSLIGINDDTSTFTYTALSGQRTVFLADFQNSLTDILIQLIHRILGFVVGGYNVLPAANVSGGINVTRTTEDNNDDDHSDTTTYYNVFSNPSSVSSFEELLSGSSLKTILNNLLTLLDTYAPAIVISILPLVMSFMYDDTTKSYDYAEGNWLATAYSNKSFDINTLKAYYDTFDLDANGHLLTTEEGKVNFRKRNDATDQISLAEIDKSLTGGNGYTEVMVEGVKYYQVQFPSTYSNEVAAKNAANNITNAYVVEYTPLNSPKEYRIYVDADYRTATASESRISLDASGNPTDGTASNGTYSYTTITGNDGRFQVATPVKTSGSYPLRSGTNGEVVYTDGYRVRDREDYKTDLVYVGNRLNNAVEDTSDFIDDYFNFVQSDLPNAYGEWLQYFVRMQLQDAGLYDTNGDGRIVTNTDGETVGDVTYKYDSEPDTPGSMYPFYATSGQANKYTVSDNKTTGYYFANYGTNSSYIAITEALNYGNDSGNDVVLSTRFTQEVVQLALGTTNFNIVDGSGTLTFDNLTADQKNAITSKCNALGLTYNQDTNVITRKAFALFTASFGGTSAFGAYKGGDSISLTPITNFVYSAEDANEVRDDIQESYIEFAQNVAKYSDGIYDHYDDMSWRATLSEATSALRTVDTTALEWVLSYTKSAYIDPSLPGNQANKGLINRTKSGRKDEGGNDIYVAKYTTSSFEEFQKAYEYGTQLLDYIDSDYQDKKTGTTALKQSLITEAFQSILTAYYDLSLRTGECDWSTLLKTIASATSYITSPLGFINTDKTETAEFGYTVETLTNLLTATNSAQALYDAHHEDYDDEKQTEVDDMAEALTSVINALRFKEYAGTQNEADIILVDDANVTVDETLPEEIQDLYNGEAFIKNVMERADGNTQKIVYVTGLKEGSGLSYYEYVDSVTGETKTVAYEDLYKAYGIVTGSTDATYGGSYNYRHNDGDGTGAKLEAAVSTTYNNPLPVQQVSYIAVMFGDLNSDTRIDGADKTIYEYYLAVGENIPGTAQQYAADVNCDGNRDYGDVAIIYNHYNNVGEDTLTQYQTIYTAD